ncbi:MAG: hypothetical protein QN229_01560 [Desulfurococcaceae archaeon TW002]
MNKKIRELVARVDSVVVLSSVRRVYKNVELSHILGVSEATLSKYYHGTTIPAYPMAEQLLKNFLSEEFARKYVGRFMNKVGWDLRRACVDPHFINYVTTYFKYKLLNKLPGFFVDKFITLPDYSLSIASHLSTSLDIPLVMTTEEDMIIGLETKSRPPALLQKGDYVSSVHAILNKEIAEYFRYLADTHNLKYVAALTIVLMDEKKVSETLKTTILNLIP